jgi:hypothetical protein
MDDVFRLDDPQPLGPTSAKPRISLLGRALCVSQRPQPSDFAGFETVLAFEIETSDQVLRFSIDARSANFMAHAIQFYLPFQSLTVGGTPSDEAANPRV